MKNYSIAIDGPAGSGKSSVAKQLAKDLNFVHINSGSFYRAVAIYFYRKQLDISNPKYYDPNWIKTNIVVKLIKDKIYLNDEDVSDLINENSISNIASQIATMQSIRDHVNKIILSISKKVSIVVDGRDIGTCVLPQATIKFFLDADVKTRAHRRVEQYKKDRGVTLYVDDVITELIERDNRDYTREIAPLAKANDAIIIDNSLMDFNQTLDKMKREYMRKVINESWKA